MEKPSGQSALSYGDFRLFWIGQLISFSGTWMHSTAQGWLVYSLTKSPLYLGLVAAASSAPVLFFTLLGGVAADRFPKRNLLLLTQSLSILPAVAIGALTSAGVITVWHVMFLVFFLGAVNALDIPTRQSFFIEMVERGNLLNAIALNSAAFNLARLIGPVIAGMAIAGLGIAACFYINALSFIPVIYALYKMKSRGMPKGERGKVFEELSEGMRFVKSEPSIWMVMLMVSIASLFCLPFVTLMPIFAEDILGVGPKGYGFLMGSAGLGAFASALLLTLKGDFIRPVRLIKISSVLFPASLIAFSASRNYYLSMAALVFTGFAAVSFLATANSSVQLASPDELRGRTMGVYTLVFLGMTPIGNSFMGIIAHAVGTPNALLGASCASMAILFIIGSRLAI